MKISVLVAALSLSMTTLLAAPVAFAAAPAVQILPSGVTVKHLTVGQGAQPTAADTVQVNYRGTLADGTEFDSSYKRGQPISFPLSQVIGCWTQGVAQMHVGGKAELTCPSDTAYGARGVPGTIPANATLTFQVELLAVINK